VKKIIFLSLIIALVGALVIPVISAPAPAEAWSGTVTCEPMELSFVTYVGVPTTLLGFIPLESQDLILTHDSKGVTAGWTAKDDAAWLNELPCTGIVDTMLLKTGKVGVSVNNDGLAAGTYTATITFTFTTAATKTITVPVTLEVRTPKVMGPLCIGLDDDLVKNFLGKDAIGANNSYSGTTARLLVNPDDGMDMQALQMDGGKWALDVQRGTADANGNVPIVGGNLTIEGVNHPIMRGGFSGLAFLLKMAPPGTLPEELMTADFGDNYAAMMMTSDYKVYVGILIADLPALLDLMPQLLPLLSGDSSSGTGTDLDGVAVDDTNSTDGQSDDQLSSEMVIPMKPLLKLLPTLMPVMTDLLSNETVIELLKPLMGVVPPVMIVMSMDTMKELFAGF
jgi:hypothetical protein